MIAPGVIAVIGAECSGKTTLARALAQQLDAALVPEALRAFVDEHGRPPAAAEQASVMAAQIASEAAAGGGWVVSDAGALMTAVYSILYYSDRSLAPAALQHHRTACALTVWCAPDIPWVADAGHRDGPAQRKAGEDVIGAVLAGSDLSVLRVHGDVALRLGSVRRALADDD